MLHEDGLSDCLRRVLRLDRLSFPDETESQLVFLSLKKLQN